MNLWVYAAREARRRPGRTLLTLAGIAAGVATVVATWVAIGAARLSCRDLFEGVAGPPTLEVSAAANAGFEPAVAAELARVIGVADVQAEIVGVASVSLPDGPAPVPVLGVEPTADAVAARFQVLTGRLPTGDEEAAVSAPLAEAGGLAPGGTLRMQAQAGPGVWRLVGTFRPVGESSSAANVVLLPVGAAQRLFGMAGRVNRLRLLLDEAADARDVEDAVAERLPAGLSVSPPGGRSQLARTMQLAAEQGLTGLCAVALVAAGFVVLNTFLLNVNERRQELAVLRCLGATPTQVRGLIVRQGVLLGLAGSVVGAGLGMLLSLALLPALGKLAGGQPAYPGWDVVPLLAGVACGMAVAVAASLLPACQAARQSPLELYRSAPGSSGERVPAWALPWGGTLLVIGALGLWCVASGALPRPVGSAMLPPAVGLLLAGAVLGLLPTFPLLLRPIARLPQGLLGLTGTVAARQLARHPGRTALTSGVLAVAAILSIGFGNVLLNMLGDIGCWCRRSIPADFLVQATTSDAAFRLSVALPDRVAGELLALDGVGAVDRIAFLPTRVDNKDVLLLARTFDPALPLPLDLRDEEEAAVRRRLAAGEAVLGKALAGLLRVGEGDVIFLDTPLGPQAVRVAGTAVEYAGAGRAIYLDWEAARGWFDLPGPHILLVTARPGRVEDVGAALQHFCDRRGLLRQSNADLRQQVDRLLAGVTASLWGLMGLAFLVASLGVANSLAMCVREQTRAVGVLRALGLTAGQVHRAVLLQALLLALVVLPAGTCCGFGVARALTEAVNGLLGYQATFRPEWGLAAVVAAAAVATSVAAALLPAARAAGLPVTEALAGG